MRRGVPRFLHLLRLVNLEFYRDFFAPRKASSIPFGINLRRHLITNSIQMLAQIKCLRLGGNRTHQYLIHFCTPSQLLNKAPPTGKRLPSQWGTVLERGGIINWLHLANIHNTLCCDKGKEAVPNCR